MPQNSFFIMTSLLLNLCLSLFSFTALASNLQLSMGLSREVLAKAACADEKYLNSCFTIKKDDCEKKFNEAFLSCVKMKDSLVPKKMEEDVVTCTMNDLRVKLAQQSKNISSCDVKRIPAETAP